MFKKCKIFICAVFFLSQHISGLYGVDVSRQFDDNDIRISALILRIAVINWKSEEVVNLLDFYKRYFTSKLVYILSDTRTSIGNKTIIEDLWQYRRYELCGRENILSQFALLQSFCLKGASDDGQFPEMWVTESDIYVLAHILRTAVIQWSCHEVNDIISLYKKCFPNKLTDILYDLRSSLFANKTMIEDLFCCRSLEMGGHKEILGILVNAFRDICIHNGMSIEDANHETVNWMIFYSRSAVLPFPAIINQSSYSRDIFQFKNGTCFEDLLLTFFEEVKRLGGMATLRSKLDSSLNGRGFSLRQAILYHVPFEYEGRLVACLAG